MINKSYLISLYTFSLLLFLNYNRTFLFWVLTEINLILFVFIMVRFIETTYKQEFYDLVIFYFFVQSISSIFLLRDFFFSGDLFIFNCEAIFFLALTLKLGIFPFFFWAFKLCDYLSLFIFWLILTLQKIPFFLIFFSNFNNWLILILVFSFIRGSVLILFSNRFNFIIVSSSVLSTFLIFYIFRLDFLFFFFFFFFYSVRIFLLLKVYFKDYNSRLNFLVILFLFRFFLGLSPLSLFFFKLSLTTFFSLYASSLELLIFWGFRFLALFGYMKFCYFLFYRGTNFYFYSVSYEKKIIFFFLSMVFFYAYLGY